uniref:Integrase core domain containing protein n=1 Tax=Solanum tuberosum TaxID=4113 RepID=M1DNB0_SOLTU
MAMRAKQKHTSLPFPILITELCRRVGVLVDPARDIEFTPSSATDIEHFKAEYICEEADRRRAAPMDTCPEINVELLLTDPSTPTLVPGTSGTLVPPPSSQDPGASSSSQPIRITQAMIVKMWHLAQSTEARATRLERSVPGMI